MASLARATDGARRGRSKTARRGEKDNRKVIFEEEARLFSFDEREKESSAVTIVSDVFLLSLALRHLSLLLLNSLFLSLLSSFHLYAHRQKTLGRSAARGRIGRRQGAASSSSKEQEQQEDYEREAAPAAANHSHFVVIEIRGLCDHERLCLQCGRGRQQK